MMSIRRAGPKAQTDHQQRDHDGRLADESAVMNYGHHSAAWRASFIRPTECPVFQSVSGLGFIKINA